MRRGSLLGRLAGRPGGCAIAALFLGSVVPVVVARAAAPVTLKKIADTADGIYGDLSQPIQASGAIAFRFRLPDPDFRYGLDRNGDVLVLQGDVIGGAQVAIPGLASLDGGQAAVLLGDDCCSGQQGVIFAAHYLFTSGGGDRILDRLTPLPGSINPTQLQNSPFDVENGVSSVEGPLFAFHLDGTHLAPYDQNPAVLVRSSGSISIVADTTDTIPGTGIAFSEFGAPLLDHGTIAFRGRGIGRGGIYLSSGGALTTIVDSTTTAPGYATPFTDGFTDWIDRDGADTAFITTGAPKGVFARVGGTLTRIADTTFAIPEASGVFFDFRAVSIDGGKVAFVGYRDNQFSPPKEYGIYTNRNGALEKVVDLHDTFAEWGGRTPNRFAMLRAQGLLGDRILFLAEFTNATDAIYLATIHPPGTDVSHLVFGESFEAGDLLAWSSHGP